MRSGIFLTMIALALPAAALAQVGPNPAVSGGSLDPTMGASRDTMTAPQDAPAELPGTGPTIDLKTRGAADATADGVQAGGDAAVTSNVTAPDKGDATTTATPDMAKGKSAKARARNPR